MKNLKNLALILLVIFATSCGNNDDGTAAYPLSYENIAGTYEVKNLSMSADITTTSNMIPIKVATASTTGDTFQVDLVMNSDGTYTAKGAYRIIAKLTPVVGSPVETSEIINIDNSGNFTLNTNNNTISFTGDLLQNLSGSLEFQTFNATAFSLFQEIEVVVGGNTEQIATNISVERK